MSATPTFAIVDVGDLVPPVSGGGIDRANALVDLRLDVEAVLAQSVYTARARSSVPVAVYFGANVGFSWIESCAIEEASDLGGLRVLWRHECPSCGSEEHHRCSKPLGTYKPTVPPPEAVPKAAPSFRPSGSLLERPMDPELVDISLRYPDAVSAARMSTANALEAVELVRNNLQRCGRPCG